MKNNFEMSMMGELKFFLGLQVHQSLRGIFISQSQYAIKLLKKHGLDECVLMSTPMATKRLDADLQGTPTDQTTYHRMIGGLMYLTASRLDIAYATFSMHTRIPQNPYAAFDESLQTAFLNGILKKEVYVGQTLCFVSKQYPDHVYALDKALYGLKQSPRAWYDVLSQFLIESDFQKVPTPMIEQAKLKLDLVEKPVDHTDYRSMIGLLMYVTSSRPDIMFATCVYERYQANPNEHHVSAFKRIFRYLKGTINLGLWYPKDSGFDLTTYSNADHARCHLDRKKSEYVAVSGCCAHVLWMRTQLMDYGFFYDKVPIYCVTPPNWVAAEYWVRGVLLHRSITQDI
nr:hypothetical protein [Tanacetum cinerariifolium]